MTDFENVEQYLPESVKGIIGAIGFANTEKLVKAFGGVSFQFSRAEAYFSLLREVLGQDVAIQLLQYTGTAELYIPRCEVALRILRNQRLYADFCQLTQEEGLSGRMAVLDLCPKYQVCDRTAWEIVRNYQRGNAYTQDSLF